MDNSSQKKRKRNLYRKSRYYRQRQKQLAVLAGAALIVIVLLITGIVKLIIPDKEAASAVSQDAKNTQTSKDQTSDNSQQSKKEEASEPVSLTISLVGDCTLGTDEAFDWSTSLNAYYESQGPDYFFQNVKSIFEQDDLTIANMEGTLTDSENRQEKQFAFKADPQYAQILTNGSVEAVTLANNHSHDYGDESYEDTKKALDDAGIVHFGFEDTALMEIKGVKIGLVGIYELEDHMERASQVKENIQKVKEEGAQLTIAVFHWGNEKETVPDSNQMQLAHLAIDNGADLVVGHHPHVLQGIEQYKGKNIVYSLGNFCFGGNSYPSDMDSMIFQQTFTIDSNKKVQEDNVTNIIPCSISSDSGYNNYQPTPAQGEEADRILEKITSLSQQIPQSGNSSGFSDGSSDLSDSEDSSGSSDSEDSYDSEDSSEDFSGSEE